MSPYLVVELALLPSEVLVAVACVVLWLGGRS